MLPERFDFDLWKALHESDPRQFEHERKVFIERIIATTSRRNRRRLQGIIFQVDAIRERSSNPLKSCVDISQMMWTCFYQLNELLNDFDEAMAEKYSPKKKPTQSATILPFTSNR